MKTHFQCDIRSYVNTYTLSIKPLSVTIPPVSERRKRLTAIGGGYKTLYHCTTHMKVYLYRICTEIRPMFIWKEIEIVFASCHTHTRIANIEKPASKRLHKIMHRKLIIPNAFKCVPPCNKFLLLIQGKSLYKGSANETGCNNTTQKSKSNYKLLTDKCVC